MVPHGGGCGSPAYTGTGLPSFGSPHPPFPSPRPLHREQVPSRPAGTFSLQTTARRERHHASSSASPPNTSLTCAASMSVAG